MNEPNQPAPVTLGVEAALRDAHLHKRRRRAHHVRLAVRGGLALLFVCVALVIGSCMMSSSRASRAIGLQSTYLQLTAEFDCGPRSDHEQCGAAADALVELWRVSSSISSLERIGGALAGRVGMAGIGEPMSAAFTDDIEARLRAWPLARARAGLPPSADLHESVVNAR